jgi:hypothetical protein
VRSVEHVLDIVRALQAKGVGLMSAVAPPIVVATDAPLERGHPLIRRGPHSKLPS